VSQRAGYTQGQAIVDGSVGTIIGGGICYVSTALYRAAFLAGLPIVERRAHSLALASFSDIPGFDAAVDTIGLDLRWRNDTPSTIAIAAELHDGQLSITLWGIGDGRSTTMRGPTVKKDTTTQHVTIGRVVRAASGALIRKETVQSHYRIAQGEL
jgi:vancomycin resistance protein YoaR